MKVTTRTVLLAATFILPCVTLAGEAMPINTTFGIQWTPVDWSNLSDRITESLGAAGLPNGKTLAVATRDHLDAINGRVTSDYVVLLFSETDWVYAEYSDIPAGYDPATNIASFGGPLHVVGGEGKFAGASGTLTIHSKILFSLPVGTFAIKGVVHTAD
jgi:hypothetical protein